MNENFPKSIFDKRTLKQIAGEFQIPKEYYGNMQKKAFRALSYVELLNIWRKEEHPITAEEMARVAAIYDNMYPFDAYFLATRLPIKTLMRITGLPIHMAAALKRACNYLRDMSPSEYARRDLSKPISTDDTPQTYRYFKYSQAMAKDLAKNPPVEHPAPKVAAFTPVQVPYEFADNKDEIVKKLRPYLTAKSYKSMPTTVRMIFKATPKHILKRLWNGKGFDKCYDEVIKS